MASGSNSLNPLSIHAGSFEVDLFRTISTTSPITMAPPNKESMIDPSLSDISSQETEISVETVQVNRPNKRVKETHHGVLSHAPSSASSRNHDDDDALRCCLELLFSDLPPSLTNKKTNDDISAFRQVWDAHGFRTSMVLSPRRAVSVYLDSCSRPTPGVVLPQGNEAGRTFLLTCIGMHPRQAILEKCYSDIRSVYCLSLFVHRLRTVRPGDMDDGRVRDILLPWEEQRDKELSNAFRDAGGLDPTRIQRFSHSCSETLSQILAKLADIDHSLRPDQLLREYDRITYENSTLANACWQRWLDGKGGRSDDDKVHTFPLDQVYFQFSPPGRYMPDRERITIQMKDGNDDEASRGKLILLPSLCQILRRDDTSRHPLHAVVENMIQHTWDDLLRNGYYVDPSRREQLFDPLQKFYESGLLAGKDWNVPILLNAHFTPTYPLSLYLAGTAGAGKSSLVRNLFPAINAAISSHCDPELIVRFVKQNLNKPFKTLQLELELRPNNNDYSVMSIIQGRRMTLSQSKPGLVLVALEEMPSNLAGRDPNQLEVSKLISLRFSGRRGEYREGDAPRNSAKRGISGDATIINIFTSNYDLEPSCLSALQRLEMFQNLKIVHVAPVAGKEREDFARSYLTQRVHESLSPRNDKLNIHLDIPFGEGDTRPLVRYLRMLSFYIRALVLNTKSTCSSAINDVSVTFDETTNITTLTTSKGGSMQVRLGSFDNIYAVNPTILDPRASEIVEKLKKLHPDLTCPVELCQILDFYFAKTLAPAVVLSKNKQLIHDLIILLSQSDEVYGITDIDPSEYKIMKSLYDSTDTPNLRDDIINILHGNAGALVAIELNCKSIDDQLQIREIIEDTPSMTAFSTERSALYKDRLFFGVFVEGPITPEIKSRASLLI
ncbi:hypothetical protein HJC23_009625 [Cyclotella cryptica]|uniref:Uncharacterized protein n=1 Tax=Cyclotella cryptica TaxID=29204 RepID=A0ABD3PWQ5_9STRA